MNRRQFLARSTLGATTTIHSKKMVRAASMKNPNFVLVHGAWHGGWCWNRVKPILEAKGAGVTAPTLTGLGERRHLIRREIDLETHVADIINHIDNEGLTNVVLVGHSYGGFPATLAATHRADVVTHLVLLDAFFPMPGETVLDHAGPKIAGEYNAKAAADMSWNIPVLPSAVFGLAGDDARWVDGLLTAHPIATYTQAARYEIDGLPTQRSYIKCTNSTVGAVLDRSLLHVRADKQFNYREITAGHDVMVDHPLLLAETLFRLA